MSELKTKPSDRSIESFLTKIEDEQKRADCAALTEMLAELTGEAAQMWGDSVVGFGSYHYKYASGREGDWFRVGFAPRAKTVTLYVMSGFDQYEELMQRLGKYKTGKSCLHFKRLADLDQAVLRELVTESLHYLRETYG